MSKVLHLGISNCTECPYLDDTTGALDDMPGGLFCSNQDSDKYIITWEELRDLAGHDGPKPGYDIIPDWCPLPDDNTKYFVVREELEDISDDEAINKVRVETVELGKETWILNSYEKDDGVELVDDINYITYGVRHRKKKVAVILGRALTEDEVDLDRENLKRNEK